MSLNSEFCFYCVELSKAVVQPWVCRALSRWHSLFPYCCWARYISPTPCCHMHLPYQERYRWSGRPPAPSPRLLLPQCCLLPAFSSLDGVYATVAWSLWCTVGRIIIPWEESFCFSGQPVVKGADMAKREREKENAGHPPPQAQCQTAKTNPAH